MITTFRHVFFSLPFIKYSLRTARIPQLKSIRSFMLVTFTGIFVYVCMCLKIWLIPFPKEYTVHESLFKKLFFKKYKT